MKRVILITSLCLFFYGHSQNNLDFKKVGDTVFYNKDYGHTDRNSSIYFAVIKKILESNSKKSYDIDFYFLDSINNNIPTKRYKSNSQRLEILSLQGKTIFFHKNGKKSSEGSMKNGRAIDKWVYWYNNGKMKMEKMFYERKILKDGKPSQVINFWDENGNKKVINGNGYYTYHTESKSDSVFHKGKLINGKKHGLWEGRNKHGNEHYKEEYKKGKLISGESWDKKGNHYTYTKEYQRPQFKRGMKSIKKLIQKNFKMPEIMKQYKIQGTVLVSFNIDVDGKIKNIKAYRKVYPEADKEAIRLVKLMKDWKPAVKKGKKIKIKYVIPITFKYH